VQFTSDGRIVSTGRDSTIRVWSADGKAKGASPKADALLTKVAASFDGKLIIAGDYRGRLQLWDGKQLTYLCGAANPGCSRLSGGSGAPSLR
jgi:WD40 repeat protein